MNNDRGSLIVKQANRFVDMTSAFAAIARIINVTIYAFLKPSADPQAFGASFCHEWIMIILIGKD